MRDLAPGFGHARALHHVADGRLGIESLIGMRSHGSAHQLIITTPPFSVSIPPPDTSEAGHPTVPAEYDHPTVPAEYDDVEDEILGAGRLKSVGFTGSRPKVSCTSRDHLQVAS
jgi:hypothetical protein